MSRSFNGSTDHLLNTSPIFPTGANPFSVAFWVLPNTNGSGFGTPVSWGKTGTNNAFIIAQDGTNLNNAILLGRYGNNALTSTTQMVQNQWNTVFVTYDGTTLSCFINGVASGTAVVTLTTSAASGSELWIGDLIQGGQAFNGFIGELLCWNVALTADNAAAFHKGVFPIQPQSQLVAYYPLWGTGASEPDWSGNANNLTITGTVRGNQAPTMSFSESFFDIVPTSATMISDDALGTQTLNATLGVGNWGAFELGEIESNFHSTASGVGRTAGVGVGTASATSTASGVGASTSANVGTASGDSTASAVGDYTSLNIGTASATSTASGVGASLVIGVGTALGTSNATGVGASLVIGVGTASGDSTASAVGDSIIAGSAATASGTSTASGVGGKAVSVSGIASQQSFGNPTITSHAHITPNGIFEESFGDLTIQLFLLPSGIGSGESVGVPDHIGPAIFPPSIDEEIIGTPTIVREVVPEVKKFIFDAVGIFEIDGNDTEMFSDDYGVLDQNIIFSGEIISVELVDPVVPKKRRLTERVQLIKVVDGNLNVFLPDVLELKHNLDKVKPLSNFFKTNNITLPGVTKVGKVNGDFIKLIYSTTDKEWRNTLHYSGRSTVDHQGSESWTIDASFGSSGRSWKFTMKLSRTRGQLVETSRIIAFYKNKYVVNKNDSFFGFTFTINPALLQSKPDVVQPIVLSDSPGFFRNLQQLAFRIFPQNIGTGSHQFPADNTLAYDATLTGGVR